jgi:threonine dehydratase
VSGIAADSLGAKRIGAIAWDITQRTCRGAAAVRRSDPQGAADAVEGLQAGGGTGRGAGLAALQTGAYVPREREGGAW